MEAPSISERADEQVLSFLSTDGVQWEQLRTWLVTVNGDDWPSTAKYWCFLFSKL